MMNFKPSLKLTILLLILAFIFGRLGFWQLERMADKRELFAEFENAPVLPVAEALQQQNLYARVQASGRYDTGRHILLDNKIHQGRAGVHVLTPFHLDDGSVLLVNRGWLPMPADRLELPAVPTDGETMSLTGWFREPIAGGVRLGEPDSLSSGQWPQLVTYLDLDAAGKALGLSLSPKLVMLDASNPSGFEGRQWKAAEMTPAIHGAYAVQWFGLAIAAVVIWVVLSVRRAGASGPKIESREKQ